MAAEPGVPAGARRGRAPGGGPALPTGVAPRRAAQRILEEVHAGRPFDAALDDAVRRLGEADRRLAHELAAGVLRNHSVLDRRLRPLVTRGWRDVAEPLRAILRLGAYQLTALDRVPPHAAVSTSVALARETGGERAAGFVNAVLRRLGRERSAIERPAGIASAARANGRTRNGARGDIDGAGARALAERYSHPEWLVRRWLGRYGAEDAERLLEWNNTRPRLVVQPARQSAAALTAAFAAARVPAEPAPYGAGLAVARGRPERLPGYERGEFVVQDPAQSLVVWFADVPPGTVAYDACAAPGGKTIGLARTGVRVVAGDATRARLGRLCDNIARAGSGREHVIAADALHPPVRPLDAVLVDAPCLGTGAFARHPDARGRVEPEALAALARRQAELLEAASGVIRPGGLLVYATCSLEPEEDEQQIDRFLDRHPEFRREPADDFPPSLLTRKGDLMTLPQRDHMDGAYAARLRRVA
ncbi:MAG TPA: transcription antitermination factor NusB [Gemmatimonadales bacterium]|nr:transcription antitermination factor NusB [Gemmatimonadales bacterium]